LEETDTSPEPEHTPEVKGNGEGADEFDWENYLEIPTSFLFRRALRMGRKTSFENFLTKRTTSQIIFGGNSNFHILQTKSMKPGRDHWKSG